MSEVSPSTSAQDQKSEKLKARKALALSRAGKGMAEIGRAFNRSRAQAGDLVALGAYLERCSESKLRDNERVLLKVLLDLDGPGSMTKCRNVDWSARRARGWTARSRARLEAWGWIEYAVNGYIQLTTAGRAAAYLLAEVAP